MTLTVGPLTFEMRRFETRERNRTYRLEVSLKGLQLGRRCRFDLGREGRYIPRVRLRMTFLMFGGGQAQRSARKVITNSDDLDSLLFDIVERNTCILDNVC